MGNQWKIVLTFLAIMGMAMVPARAHTDPDLQAQIDALKAQVEALQTQFEDHTEMHKKKSQHAKHKKKQGKHKEHQAKHKDHKAGHKCDHAKHKDHKAGHKCDHAKHKTHKAEHKCDHAKQNKQCAKRMEKHAKHEGGHKHSHKAGKGPEGLEVKWEPAPSIKSADGEFEMNVRGRLYVDTAWASDDDDTMDVQATEFRTARLGIEGKAGKSVKYKFEADFAHDDVVVKDAFVEVKTAIGAKVTAGQFKTPNSLDEQTSSRHTSLMERASFTDAFGLARRIGVGLGVGGDNWSAKLGVYRGANNIDEEDEGHEIAGRATYSPMLGEAQLHLGASFRTRDAGDQSDYKYSQRPHQHLASKFVNTGSVAPKDTFYGLEAAVLHGPLWAASEYAWLKADDDAGEPTFSGGYVELGYFLTGEKRGYKPSKGAWDRPKVTNKVGDGGMGAWALTARYDVLDLTDGAYFGGKQDTYILGVNWYLNRYTRLLFNYNHSSIEDAFDVSANGFDGKNEVDAFGVRAQVDW